ncbi:MAG: ribosomal L7Ae/L30e/S12e/Gadd45 family protein [Candidatus Aenigmarchaeota archaeon]|nr:ribosomal L7Ae/L30e/S12e/Gadd45 family protein [Candidatus Aenigmarchaeota archaeon]MDW8149152.1 ribosomal L7Ae/L30e/S12e/Gadd45 family protein [Candidatus Aenigmarchaeota archaeon]
MTNIKKIIDDAIKENKAVFGFREVYKALKNELLKKIIVAKNIEEYRLKDIMYNAKIFKTEILIFEGSSRELGILAGKPYVISTIGIKK